MSHFRESPQMTQLIEDANKKSLFMSQVAQSHADGIIGCDRSRMTFVSSFNFQRALLIDDIQVQQQSSRNFTSLSHPADA